MLRISARRLIGMARSLPRDLPLAPTGCGGTLQPPWSYATGHRLSPRRGICDVSGSVKTEGVLRLPPNVPLYFGGPCPCRDKELENMEVFVKDNPLLIPVHSGRLIIPDPLQPYLCSEACNKLIISGARIVRACHQQNISTRGLFRKGNVAVLKKLCALFLHELNPPSPKELEDAEIQLDYEDYWTYMQKLFMEVYGNDISQEFPPDLAAFGRILRSCPVDEELVVNYAGFLGRRGRAAFITASYMYLEENVPLHLGPKYQKSDPQKERDLITAVDNIYKNVPYTNGNNTGFTWVQSHTVNNVMECWYPKRRKKERKKPRTASASGLFVLHRHSIVHYFSQELLDTIKDLIQKDVLANLPSDPRLANLLSDPPSFEEVIDLTHYTFPMFCPRVQMAFKEEGDEHYRVLRMRDLFDMDWTYDWQPPCYGMNNMVSLLCPHCGSRLEYPSF